MKAAKRRERDPAGERALRRALADVEYVGELADRMDAYATGAGPLKLSCLDTRATIAMLMCAAGEPSDAAIARAMRAPRRPGKSV